MGLIEETKKKYGDSLIFTASDLVGECKSGYPTGVLNLDRAIGSVGGVPCGRVTEFYGPPYSAKTTLAISTIANMHKQHPSGLALYIDAENAMDLDYTSKCGVDLQRMVVARPEIAEQAFDIAEAAIRSGEYLIVVVDSIPALSPRAEMEGDIGDAHVGLLPRLLSQFLRKTAFAIRESDVALILINQVRDKISRVPFPQLETPGGYALKHHTSLMVMLRHVGEVKTSGGDALGSKISFVIKKNKVGSSYGTGEFEVWSDRGVNTQACVVDMALESGVIKQKGSWFSFEDSNLAQGRVSLIELLTKDQDLFNKIVERIK